MLKVANLNVHYGGIHALRDVSLNVAEEKIITLIGANGAGKSTLLRTVCGLAPATGGSVKFLGREILGLPTHRITQDGIAMAPEGRKVFVNVSVYENLLMGAYNRAEKEEIQKDIDMVFETFPRLKERATQSAGTLSGGEQQMLAVGRALMSRPKLLLLDEPSLGLAPVLVQLIFETIGRINRESNTTIFLVEQNANMALRIAHRGYVMESGAIALEDTAANLLKSEKVKAAYLGL